MTPNEFIQRELEIMKAQREFPGMEVGEAYELWKNQRGEKAVKLNTSDETVKFSKLVIQGTARRKCNQIGCVGFQILEVICAGCVEGRKGYKTKWTCEECLHRELSTKEYLEWLKELSSFVKE